jgi:WD domain, G-beta repeat
MAKARQDRGGPVRGAHYRDGNKQWNYFDPITRSLFTGASERLRDVCFDPAPLARDLDLAHFTGREWLIEKVDGFIEARSRGHLIIRAETGLGKSTLAAHLVGTRPWLHHFTRLPGGRSPEAARKSLAAQLIARWDLLDEWAPGGVLPPAAAEPDWFAWLLDAAARKCREEGGGEHIVLVVDGLDEAEAAAEAEPPAGGGLPLGLPESLPDGVFVVATSRFGIDPARNPADWLEIEVEGADNLADMLRFIDQAASPDGGDGRLIEALGRAGVDPARFRRELASSCAGVWLYLRYVLDEIRAGTRDPRDVGHLPEDLAGYYVEQVQRWRGDPDDEAARHRWEQGRLPLLGVLAVARAPLTVAELASLSGGPTAAARAFIEETCRAFLNPDDNGPPGAPRYAVGHQSLRDLLTGNSPGRLAAMFAAQTKLAHQQITSALTPVGPPAERDWESVGRYARRHLAAHAAACDALDDLAGDPGFLLATDPGSFLAQRASLRTQGGKRALAALELSLGGWEAPAGTERMADLAASAARVHAQALVTACAQRCADEWPVGWAAWAGEGYRQLTGYDDWVFAVAAGRVGDRDVLVSGASDGTVRIWDPVTGSPSGESLHRHDHAVYAVATGRTGNRDVIISGARDGTVRTWDTATGNPTGPRLAGHDSAVTAVATGRIGNREVVISGARDGTVRAWDAVNGKPAGATLTGHGCEVTAVATGQDGDRDIIITGCRDGTVRIRDAATGSPMGPTATGLTVTGHHSPVTFVAKGRAGERDVIISGDSQGTVMVGEYLPE